MRNLIKRAKYDPQAFAELYRLHFQSTYNYIAFRLHNEMETEDLVSQSWELVLKNITNLKSNHPIVFRAWLFTILRNTLQKYFIAKPKNTTLPLEDYSEKLSTPNADSPLVKALKNDQIVQMGIFINALPEKQKELIILHFGSDLRNKEIAKILNISEKTVASNLCRALETLRKNYKNLQ